LDQNLVVKNVAVTGKFGLKKSTKQWEGNEVSKTIL